MSPALSNPYGMRAGLAPLLSDAQAGSGLPVSPDRSAAEMAGELSTLIEGADGLLREPGSKARLQGILGAIATLVRQGSLVAARTQAELLVAMAEGEIANRLTLAELSGSFRLLVRSIDQHIANVPPTPHPGGPYDLSVPAGGSVYVHLDGRGSVDPDSTPGTTDNIRHYRWYDERRTLLGDEPVSDVRVIHDGGSGPTVRMLTLELEDAYGAVASVPVAVTLAVEGSAP